MRLDEDLIQKVKRISKRSGKSVSQMVADYFSLLGENDPDQREITPRVRSLLGALSGTKVSEGDYRRHLEAKDQAALDPASDSGVRDRAHRKKPRLLDQRKAL